MADFSALIAQIEAYVKQNGNNEITGNGLQSILVGMVNALGTVAITAVQGDLADEVTARQNADGTLQQGINTERQQRQDADGAINAKIPAEASSSNKLADKAFVTGLTTALQNAVNAINANIENGYVYAGIAIPSGTPVSGRVFYLARQAGTYTNFGGLTLTEGVNVLKYNGTAWSQEQLISIADIYKNPLMGYYECDTAGGTAAKTVAATGYVLPTTGGSVKIKMANRNTVANATLNINSTGAKPLFYNGQRAGVGNTWDTNEIVEVFYDGTNYQAYNVAGSNGDGVFDISAYNLTDGQPTPYVDLEAALGTNGEHVPQSLRKGGMSVKFIQGTVQSSDNNYVQYRFLLSGSFTNAQFANAANWQVDKRDSVLIKHFVTAFNQYTDWSVGDVAYFTDQKILRKVMVLVGTTVNTSESVSFDANTIYIYNNHVYLYDGTELTVDTQDVENSIKETNNHLIRIKAILNTPPVTGNTWAVGDVVYIKSTNALRRCIESTAGAFTSSELVPFYDNAVYIYNDEYYSWDGTEFVLCVNENRISQFLKTKDLFVPQGVITTDLTILDNETRISTELIKATQTTTITTTTGYQLLVRIFDDALQIVSSSDWLTSYQMEPAEDRYYCFIVRKSNNSEISVDEFTTAISADFSNCSFYLQGNIIKSIQDGLNTKIVNITTNLGAFNKTKQLQVANCSYSDSQVVLANDARLSTGLIQFPSDRTLTANSGYLFIVRVFDKDLNLLNLPSNWVTSYTFTAKDRYYLLTVKKEDNSTIQTSEFSVAVSGDFTGCKYFVSPDIISNLLTIVDAEIKSEVSRIESLIPTNFELNRNLVGLNDMTWEYQNWVFPQVISYKGVRDNLYFTFTNDGGFSGIAQYNYTTKEVTKTFLKKGVEVNDHNLIAIIMRNDKKLLCAFSGGHNTDNKIIIRIADAKESIESFGESIVLECSDLTSYAQLFQYDNKIYIFYRLRDKKWAYRISSDGGETWADEVILVTSSIQYYCQFTETTTSGVLRMIGYSNPNYDDTDIRMGFLHLDNMTLYDTDNQTVIGTTNISKDDITVIVLTPTGKKIRMFNSAKTAINDTKVLYCLFSTGSDGEYYVYDNGTSYKIADSGQCLWGDYVQNGIAWIGVNQIAVSRESQGVDYIEIYDYENGVSTLNREVASGRRSEYKAVFRPMIDNLQKAMVYLRGWYGSYYTYFEADGNVEELT